MSSILTRRIFRLARVANISYTYSRRGVPTPVLVLMEKL